MFDVIDDRISQKLKLETEVLIDSEWNKKVNGWNMYVVIKKKKKKSMYEVPNLK